MTISRGVKHVSFSVVIDQTKLALARPDISFFDQSEGSYLGFRMIKICFANCWEAQIKPKSRHLPACSREDTTKDAILKEHTFIFYLNFPKWVVIKNQSPALSISTFVTAVHAARSATWAFDWLTSGWD